MAIFGLVVVVVVVVVFNQIYSYKHGYFLGYQIHIDNCSLSIITWIFYNAPNETKLLSPNQLSFSVAYLHHPLRVLNIILDPFLSSLPIVSCDYILYPYVHSHCH